uniref:Cyclin I n=1 Tax=Astyanax mexicanus TaxID=7994 RepID=A0A3B1IRZ8_ASTMX
MKFAEPLEGRKLSFLLEKAASREARLWTVYVPKKPSNQDTDISPAQRDEAVRWLADVHHQLKLYPETLCLAISMLDRFLSAIKRIPALRELIGCSKCGCTPSEILRMERIILDKLNWDLHTATPLDFLHIFHAMVFSCKAVQSGSVLSGLNRSQHLALLTQELLHCLSHNALLSVRGSMLALALVTLQLEKLCPDWLALTVDLLRKSQIDSLQLIGCRELVARCLSTHSASLPPNTVYICHPLRPPPSEPWGSRARSFASLPLRRKPSAKRKVEQMDVDEYFDGIKRLYNEDSPQEGGSSPCPALQPVTAS